MTAQESMKQLVAEQLAPLFKARGFKKSGLTFHRRVEKNYAIVQLQKSISSTAVGVSFTINLGVFSERVQRGLAKITWVPDVAGVPSEVACHLRQRIGPLMPEAQDKWWSIGPATDQATLGATIRSAIETHALPFLEARVSDEGLRDHWLAGTKEPMHDLALAVLLREIGPRVQLESLLHRLRAQGTGALPYALDRFCAELPPE
jgi:hypothetical protein